MSKNDDQSGRGTPSGATSEWERDGEFERAVTRALGGKPNGEPAPLDESSWLEAALQSEGTSSSQRSDVAFIARLAADVDETLSPPRALRKRLADAARQMFRTAADRAPQTPSLWVRWKADALEVLEGLRMVVAEPAFAVRSQGEERAERTVRVRAPLSDESGFVDVELARSGGQQFALHVAPECPNDVGEDRVRVSLFREGREYRSGFATAGGLRFANLNPGAYVMRIRVGSRDCGELPIRVEEETSPT